VNGGDELGVRLGLRASVQRGVTLILPRLRYGLLLENGQFILLFQCMPHYSTNPREEMSISLARALL
jgi:hypothetical protein